MKFNFRKIASVLASTIMLSSTVALAAAANYPAPFVQAGAADVAVVYGASAAQTDMVAATDIVTSLQSALAAQTASKTTTESSTVSGGDFVKLERKNDKFNLGNNMSDFYSSLDDGELSKVLASGTYMNNNNDEFDYEQSITLSPGLTLTHFVDSELDEDEKPVIGFDLKDGQHILNYTLKFTDEADADGAWTKGNALENTKLIMLGRTYYVVSARNTSATDHKLTLLDTANSAVVKEGETTSIVVGGKSYDVSIEFVSKDEVILVVNGVKTNKLGEGDTFKVEKDLYVSVKDILYSEKESGVSKVDISLGSGKIVLENEKEVEINNEKVSTNTDSVLKSYIDVDGNKLKSITLEWILDDDAWIVPGRDLVLPGFETIKLSMGGFKVSNVETIKVEPDGDSIRVTAPIEDGEVKLNLFYLNGSKTGISGLGEKSKHKLVTVSGTSPTVTLNKSEKSYFVATWISTGNDAESYAFEIKSINQKSNGDNETVLTNLADTTKEVKFTGVGDNTEVGRIKFTLNAANENNGTATIAMSATSGKVYADRVVTKEGLMFKLPVVNNSDSGIGLDGVIRFRNETNETAYDLPNPTFWNMNFTEEDKDGNIAGGKSVVVKIETDGDDGLEPTKLFGVDMLETGDDTDQYEGYVVSDIATRFWQDKPSSGLNKLKVEYPGEESYGEVYISETGAVVVSGTVAAGLAPITDAEASGVTKNLIVVGGSCVNTVAAELLGGALCGADFEAKTGVGAGSFLIETFSRAGGKVATLVAGYNAGDTTNAATYLRTQTVDTTVGKKYRGTSATSATLVTD